MSDLSDIVNEFLVESHENLDQLDRDLVALERDPSDRATLASIFRTIHTIKGTSGFLAFRRLESVTHVGESLLSRLRDGVQTLTPEITSALLAMVDAVRQMLASIEKTTQDGDADYTALISQLTALQVAGGTAKPAEPSPGEAIAAAAAEAALGPTPIAASTPPAEPAREEAQEWVAPGPEVATAAPVETSSKAGVTESNIRVDVGLLDKLMNLVGELVLARNQILQWSSNAEDNTFLATTQRLNLITTELQEGVMKTRMQPIGNLWSKFPRVVRDLATACGKKIRIEMEGKETELDKTILESIKDPLTHIVRNSADHGIEAPDARRQCGKPEEGRLYLRAYHEGGQVNIEISDDGAGIDSEKVRQKALKRGLITAEQATRMSDRELVNLIFLPGFSTAEQVTNVSGRGVGMDVVKTNIEKIGGTVEVQSRPGHGTTLKIKIPLTLAIIPALIVTTGGDRFAIPQVSLLELVRLEGEQARRGIERIHGAEVYRLRGNLLPLIHLSKELAIAEPERGGPADVINIVVLSADDRAFGLVVDEINDTEEIVVKPLGKQLKGLSVFAGATIMGDGRVALILDVLGTAQRSNVVSELHERSASDGKDKDAAASRDLETLLLFAVGEHGRFAIPLSLVARLEEVPIGSVERAGEDEVVQYRGHILPLFRLSKLLPETGTAQERDPMQVVVYSQGDRSVGLVVDRILDIVDEHVVLERRSCRAGVRGSAVIQGRVTDLLDVQGIIRAIDPNFFESIAA